MTSASEYIAGRVRDRVRRAGEEAGAHAAERYVREEVRRYAEHELATTDRAVADESRLGAEVLSTLTGYGPLQELLEDPEVEEIWINGPTRVFVAKGGVSELTPIVLTEAGVRDLVERMLRTSGRRVDLSTPFVDASLDDGSRLHVVIPDVTRRHVSVNIRKFHRRIRDLDDLVRRGSLTRQAAAFLRACVRGGQNMLVSGATQAGKTTLLGALLSSARPADRVITVEETFELDLQAADVVAMQCRQPSLEGTGEITLRRLVKEALRMRPDRLVVGEVREAESLDLLIALNSGVPGACSLHANSARDAIQKLCTLPLLAGRNIDAAFVVPTVASCIDVVVHCAMDAGGRRSIEEISAPTGVVTGSVVEMSRIFSHRDGELVVVGTPPRTRKFEAAGIDVNAVLRGGRG